jgi:glyoxylate reductase
METMKATAGEGSSPRLADRLALLGTETAYDVAAEAAELASKEGGRRTIYPFHIGDENFGTAPAIVRACRDALGEGAGITTRYAPAAGCDRVRAAVASHVSGERNLSQLCRSPYAADNVLVQPGGKPVILKFLLSTMDVGDAVAYPSPGYPIYESLIRFFGGVPRPYSYKTDEATGALCLDMDSLRRAVAGDCDDDGNDDDSQKKPARCLIWNDMHNPTGYCATAREHEQVAKIAVEHDLWVLDDEAYFHIVYDEADRGRSIVQQPGMLQRTCILLTCSKTWAMTGWRIGAAVGPREIIRPMIKLATNDEGCTNHFCQLAAATAFRNEPASVRHSSRILAELRRRRDLLVSLLGDVPGFVVPGGVAPRSTFYVWVDVTGAFAMLGIDVNPSKAPGEVEIDYEMFRKRILDCTGVSFCTRVHFGAPLPGETRRYVRFAYSGCTEEEIRAGIDALKTFMAVVSGIKTFQDEHRHEHVGLPTVVSRDQPHVAAPLDSPPVKPFPRRLELGRKPLVFCTRQIPSDAFEILDGVVDLEIWQDYDPPPRQVLLEKVRDCDGLISLLTDRIDEELLSECSGLQVICQLAVGYDNIDLAACTRRGVRVSNTPGVLTDTVAETALALAFACGRRVREADGYVRAGCWRTAWHPLMLLGSDLHGTTVGVAGLGRIGGKLARVAREIGARVIYHDLRQNAELEAAGIVERVQTLEELCEQSDVISIHYNLTPETYHIFDAKMLAKCKPNCIIVNTSRGPVVDQKALAKALQDGTIAAAGLDVFEQEPIPADDPLLQCHNAVLFPHLGSASTGTRAAMSRLVGLNMRAYWKGERMPQLVNTEVEKRDCCKKEADDHVVSAAQ